MTFSKFNLEFCCLNFPHSKLNDQFFFQPSWQPRGEPPHLYGVQNWVGMKLHYWIGIHGSGIIIGPFFYPVVEVNNVKKCIMDRHTHYEYV